MAVGRFLKSSGSTALALGMLVAGLSVAHAQEMSEQHVVDVPSAPAESSYTPAPSYTETYTAPEPMAAPQSYSAPEPIAAPPSYPAPEPAFSPPTEQPQAAFQARTMDVAAEQMAMRSDEPVAPAIAAGVILAQADGRRGGGGGNWGGGGEGRGRWSGGDNGGGQAPAASPAPTPAPAPTWNNGGGAASNNGNWSRQRDTEDRAQGSGGGWRGRRDQTATAAPTWNNGAQSAQAAPAPTNNGTWAERRGDRQNQGAASSWNNGGAVTAPVQQTQRRDRGNRSEANRGGEWAGRNRSYVDPNRNNTYRRDDRRDDARRDSNSGWRNDRHDNDRSRWGYSNNNRGWNNNTWSNRNSWNNNSWGYNNSYNRWDRDWRRDNRYDWYGYRSSNRDVFRMGRYSAPYRNYSYRRLSIGFYLDSLFFSSNYWISDPWNYRLPDVDGPYRWVRYYDDALLVDTYTGEVVDVIYNFFW